MKRKSGVLTHISSLSGNYSCGAFGKEAREFVNVIASAGFSVWQTLPFCYPDEVGSPYKSFGAFSGNPYFIDLENLPSLNSPLLTILLAAHIRISSKQFPSLWSLNLPPLEYISNSFSNLRDISEEASVRRIHGSLSNP